MARVEKVESWSIYKYFDAQSLEDALKIAKGDEQENWQYSEDDSIDYYLGKNDA